jgi:hypothetical protein
MPPSGACVGPSPKNRARNWIGEENLAGFSAHDGSLDCNRQNEKSGHASNNRSNPSDELTTANESPLRRMGR